MHSIIKKIFVLLFIIQFIFSFSGCSKNNKPSTTDNVPMNKTESKKSVIIVSSSPESKKQSKYKSGLLLALRDYKDTTSKTNTYRTLWIAPKGDDIMVITEGKGILVPYENDFWYISQQEIKEKNKDFSYFTSYPVLSQKTDNSPQLQEAPGVSFEFKCNITFVGNKYLCIDNVNSWKNENTSYGMVCHEIGVRDINTINEYNTMFENTNYFSAKDAFGDKIVPFIEKIAEEKVPDGYVNVQEMNGHNWAISRNKGKWIPHLANNILRGNTYSNYILKDIPLEMPKSIVSYDELTPDWNTIKKAVPDATDAVSSPSKDMLAVFTSGKLSIYVNPLNGITKPVLSIPIEKNESMIMDQWAVGDYVNKWTTEISKYLK
ncbi:MAG TPA: hypothetical protein VF941_05035 [Clostridia bacterium]